MHSLSWVLIRRRRHLARHPRRGPVTRSSDVSVVNRCKTPGRNVPRATWRRSVVLLSLTELEPLARSRPARLLALHHALIARQESLLPQLLAVLLVRQAQRPCDRQPQPARSITRSGCFPSMSLSGVNRSCPM